ncbi:MAG: hypothetical protein QOK27_674 [Gemmatimonadales bacterium]|jgi:hypothetical protein|nr:hypothetical protein [Gemmatimonadales bacterium]
MRSFPPTLLAVLAAVSLTAGCSPDPVSPPATDRSPAGAAILTSFDRLTLSRGESSSFRASVIGSGARLSYAGLTFASRATSVAGVTAANGRAQVEGLTAGRTWVVVQSAAAVDSVEVIVD